MEALSNGFDLHQTKVVATHTGYVLPPIGLLRGQLTWTHTNMNNMYCSTDQADEYLYTFVRT